MKTKIGFIGQGYIGKNYSDDFENRGYKVVRYARSKPHNGNKESLKECDIVFIAVPTPTTPKGFDFSAIKEVIPLVGENAIVVIKSTMLPESTKLLQEEYPNIIILFSPEFLSEATAAYDAANPFANVIGMPSQDEAHKKAAALVHKVLPEAPFTLTCDSTEAEIIKYTHNINAYVQIVTFNIFYDLAETLGAKWKPIENAVKADPFICNRYASPVHKSGRGAGGHCFIKDFEAFSKFYDDKMFDESGERMLATIRDKNMELLLSSNKDLDLLEGVYGTKIIRNRKEKN